MSVENICLMNESLGALEETVRDDHQALDLMRKDFKDMTQRLKELEELLYKKSQ